MSPISSSLGYYFIDCFGFLNIKNSYRFTRVAQVFFYTKMSTWLVVIPKWIKLAMIKIEVDAWLVIGRIFLYDCNLQMARKWIIKVMEKWRKYKKGRKPNNCFYLGMHNTRFNCFLPWALKDKYTYKQW